MKRIFAVTALCTFLISPAFAQTEPKEDAAQEAPTAEAIANAVKSLESFIDDKAKTDGYCAILKELEAVPEGDDAKVEEVSQKLDAYIGGLSEDVQNAFTVAEAVAPDSPDAQKIDEAFGKLEEQCAL